MNPVTRRNVLKGAAVAGVATAAPLGAAALGPRRLVIFDSRLPASLAFARTMPAAQAIDLAEAHATRFTALRQDLPKGLTVEGLTRRSDLIALRHELGRQGWRLSAEAPIRGLFRWTMRQR
jgi:hypothetical protein